MLMTNGGWRMPWERAKQPPNLTSLEMEDGGMRAMQIIEWGKPLEAREYPDPEPKGEEVLLRVLAPSFLRRYDARLDTIVRPLQSKLMHYSARHCLTSRIPPPAACRDPPLLFAVSAESQISKV